MESEPRQVHGAPYGPSQLHKPCVFWKLPITSTIPPTDPGSPSSPMCPAALQPPQICSVPPGHTWMGPCTWQNIARPRAGKQG